MFQMEDFTCNEEVFKDFYNMQARLKPRILAYLKEVVTFDYHVGDPIKEDEKQKFLFQSMIMNLEDVKVLYDFFKDYMEEFTTSKQSIKNLCQK